MAEAFFYHIESKHIEEGSKYYDFTATDSEGKTFLLSSLKNKNILFLYGGLGCMGDEGRDYLNKIYTKTSQEDFEVVVYCLSSDLASLQEVRKIYPCEFPLVSDFNSFLLK